jgi:soluble lytic murein transglycosylase
MIPLLVLLSTAFALAPNVRTAVSVGDCDAILRDVPAPTTDAEQFVVGRCLIETGAAARAIPVLESVGDGPLAAHARLLRGEALLALGRAEDALRAVDGLKLSGEPGLRARVLRGRALIALGRSLDARPDLRALLETSVADEALYWLAAGAEDRGEVPPAIAAYRDLWATSVRGSWSEKAAERLHALGADVPDLGAPDGIAVAVKRVRALERAYRFGEALALRRRILEVAPDHALGAPLDLARASAKGRDYPASIALYRQLYGEPAAAAGPPQHLFDYALNTSRTGDYDTAATIYRRLIAEHPGADEAVTAAFKLGYLEVDRGAHAAAIPLFEAYLAAHPRAPQADEARWWIGWARAQQGDLAGAIAAWNGLVEAHPSSGLVPAARYWTARARGRSGDAAAEAAGLRAVLERHPFTGYAWYAAERLGHRFAPRADPERPAWPSFLADRPEIRRAEALAEVGLFDAARAELTALVPEAKGTRLGALAMAWALIDVGAIRDAQELARPFCAAPQASPDPVAAAGCWPRPAWDVVQALSARHGLPPLVAYGIMVTESALDPSVTSLAGARGLMQIMPAEAERLHRGLYGDRAWHPDLLYRPSYNVSLGVTELGEKRRALDGLVDGPALVPAIAAYNGGAEAVRRWVAEQGGAPEFDEFAERISFTETRRYVRSVLGTTMLYRHVYGDR